MLDSFFSRARANRLLRSFICQLTAIVLALTTFLPAQQPPTQKPANPTPATRLAEAAKASPDEPALAPLVQLNNALESLAAKVSPAVVQILVTGYGPLHEDNHTQPALIVRQHAVGSGVIVDSSGYIMTNAHRVEGAQRLRVALPLPGDSSRAVAEGRRRVFEARPVGAAKETGLGPLNNREK